MPEPIQKELVAPSDTRHLAMIREAVSSTAALWFQEKTTVTRITLAVDEAVANVMEHAYKGMEPGEIRLLIDANDDRFAVTVMDHGREFNPDSIASPDMQEHVKLGKRSGLGVFLMRQIMDEVKYSFVENKRNELRMVKYVPKQEKGDETCQS